MNIVFITISFYISNSDCHECTNGTKIPVHKLRRQLSPKNIGYMNAEILRFQCVIHQAVRRVSVWIRRTLLYCDATMFDGRVTERFRQIEQRSDLAFLENFDSEGAWTHLTFLANGPVRGAGELITCVCFPLQTRYVSTRHWKWIIRSFSPRLKLFAKPLRRENGQPETWLHEVIQTNQNDKSTHARTRERETSFSTMNLLKNINLQRLPTDTCSLKIAEKQNENWRRRQEAGFHSSIRQRSFSRLDTYVFAFL